MAEFIYFLSLKCLHQLIFFCLQKFLQKFMGIHMKCLQSTGMWHMKLRHLKVLELTKSHGPSHFAENHFCSLLSPGDQTWTVISNTLLHCFGPSGVIAPAQRSVHYSRHYFFFSLSLQLFAKSLRKSYHRVTKNLYGLLIHKNWGHPPGGRFLVFFSF